MVRRSIFLVLLVLALVTIACGINIDLPVTEVKTGPTQTDEIAIKAPDTEEVIDLKLSFGAGTLSIKPGDDENLVSGTATYNVEDFKPEIESSKNSITLKQGNFNIKGIPSFEDRIKNEWDLKLNDTPINLHISAGAYAGKYEFGGLSLQSLEISDGASDVNLSFAEPNQIDMDTFRYNTGASNVTLEGLSNTNASMIIFRGGAGSYKLGFEGKLQKDAVVSIDSGISSLVIVVPEGISTQVTVEGGLSNIDTFGSWKKSGDSYSLSGEGSQLTILIKMSAGSLELRNK